MAKYFQQKDLMKEALFSVYPTPSLEAQPGNSHVVITNACSQQKVLLQDFSSSETQGQLVGAKRSKPGRNRSGKVFKKP